MSESNERQTPPVRLPLTDLMARYRTQRQAWLVQADELARLRDEVRAAAEREALEIVTGARQDVRRIVVGARRQLLVLTAQVHAAIEASKASETAASSLQSAGTDSTDPRVGVTDSGWGVARNGMLSARRDVRHVLEEARAEIDALSAGARELPPEFPTPLLTTDKAPETAFPRILVASVASRDDSARPASAQILRIFLAFSGAVGVVLLVGALWWMRSNGSSPEEVPQPAVARSAPANVEPAQPSVVAKADPASLDHQSGPTSLSLLIEARRPAWIRATVDGRTEAGRTFDPGETRQVLGARDVLLRVGDAGAVFVSQDGGEAQVFGRDGRALTRRFTLKESTAPAPVDTTITGVELLPLESPASQEPWPVATALAQRSAASQPLSQPGAIVESAPARGADAPPLPSVGAASGDALPEASLPVPTQGTTESPALVSATGLQSNIVTAGQQWLDAYQRRDRNAMAAFAVEDIVVSDERLPNERPPAGLDVGRVLEQVQFELVGDAATLTAVMKEQVAVAGTPRQHVSRISQTWLRQAGQWRLIYVRMISEAMLNQLLR